MFAKNKDTGCIKVKSGTFYFYPENSKKGFIVFREKGIQSEFNLATSDTSYWQVLWKNDCEFQLKFIRKSNTISNEEKDFYDSHISVVRILKVANDYYVFKAGLDSLNNAGAVIDTFWFKPQAN